MRRRHTPGCTGSSAIPYKRSSGGACGRGRQRVPPGAPGEDQKNYTPSSATYHHRRRPITWRMTMGLWNRFGVRKQEEETAAASVDAEEDARMAGLAESLESADIATRWRAVRAFGEMGEAAVLPLMKALEDEDWCIRRAAAGALGRAGPAAIPHLIGTFSYADDAVREDAAWALRLIGSPAVDALKQAAREGDGAIRCGALEALGSGHAGDVFLEALGDDDPRVRRCAIAGVRRSGDERGMESLVGLLRDPDEQVRSLAADALSGFGDGAVSPCIEALGDDDEDLRRRSAAVLARIGAPAVGSLSAALRDERPSVRRWAARVLGEVRAGEAVAPLIETLSDPDREVRRYACGALADIGAPAVGPLIEALGNGDEAARHRAMEALWRAGEAAAPALIDLAGTGDAGTRRESTIVLGEIGAPGASEALQTLLQDPDRDVRREAFEALETIKARGDLA
ncbi:PBS lyase [Methanoculleus sp. CWC-02]|uniref:PBS lyase n=2 Tax=Methanoculleus oceani TaxID=2184756 RepID=A0ABD4TCW6_9EURY|nr:PBS lyase [Methanoculleus sp. CWC-02]